jgi:hypothetical protein
MGKQEQERLHPKLVMRRVMEFMPADLEPHLRDTILALYACSGTMLLADDLDAGIINFTTCAAVSQMAPLCGVNTRQFQNRLRALREIGLLTSTLNKDRNKGNNYEVTYSATSRSGLRHVIEYPGGHVIEEGGHVIEDLRSRNRITPSVFSGSSGEELLATQADTEERFAKTQGDPVNPEEQAQCVEHNYVEVANGHRCTDCGDFKRTSAWEVSD